VLLSYGVNVKNGGVTTRDGGDSLRTNCRIGKYRKPAAPGDGEPAVHVNLLVHM